MRRACKVLEIVVAILEIIIIASSIALAQEIRVSLLSGLSPYHISLHHR